MNNTNEKMSPFVAASAVLHGGLVFVVMFAPSLFPARQSELWGNSNDPNISVGLAQSLPGIPLPSPPVVQETARGFTSEALHPAEPAPKAPVKPAAPEEADIKVPSATTKTPKKPDPAPPSPPRNDTPEQPPTNAIPGTGGQIALPYGQVGGGGAQASFADQAFGTRFPEYVSSMTRAITLAWQDSIVGVPRGSSSRVYVTFTIGKRGQVSNLELSQRSGSVQLDNSAQRAVLTAKLPELPREFLGANVDVRFYFEYKR
jgi:TonB family protein